MHSYIFLVYLYSTFVHANLNWRFPLVDKLLVTPRFHHWHTALKRKQLDVNSPFTSIAGSLFAHLFSSGGQIGRALWH